jgi:hypothetical protein
VQRELHEDPPGPRVARPEPPERDPSADARSAPGRVHRPVGGDRRRVEGVPAVDWQPRRPSGGKVPLEHCARRADAPPPACPGPVDLAWAHVGLQPVGHGGEEELRSARDVAGHDALPPVDVVITAEEHPVARDRWQVLILGGVHAGELGADPSVHVVDVDVRGLVEERRARHRIDDLRIRDTGEVDPASGPADPAVEPDPRLASALKVRVHAKWMAARTLRPGEVLRARRVLRAARQPLDRVGRA